MNKDTRIAMIEVNRNKKGKLFITTNLDAVPVEAVNELINGVADRAYNEAIDKMSGDKFGAAVSSAVNHFIKPWKVTTIIEFVFIILLVLERVL